MDVGRGVAPASLVVKGTGLVIKMMKTLGNLIVGSLLIGVVGRVSAVMWTYWIRNWKFS